MPLALRSRSAVFRTLGLLAASGAVAVFAGCGGSDSDGGESSSGGSGITATAGDQIFKDANCSSCHTLAAADAGGRIGPSLDEVKPDAGTVVEYVTNGEGSMPSFKNRLSTEQIQAVADYVSSVAGQ